MNEQQGRFDQTNEQARSRSDQLAALLETHAASVQAQSGRLNDVSNQVKRLGPLLEKSARDAETRWADLAGALNEQSAKLEERSERTRSRIDRLAELLDEQAARTAFGSQEAERDLADWRPAYRPRKGASIWSRARSSASVNASRSGPIWPRMSSPQPVISIGPWGTRLMPPHLRICQPCPCGSMIFSGAARLSSPIASERISLF